MSRRIALLVLTHLASAASAASYVAQTETIPKGMTLEVGGICFTQEGTLLVSTRWGEVWAKKGEQWKLFASGLHEPLGIWAEHDAEVYVMQRPELTRITASQNDGVADTFETVCDDWYMKGLETEYTYGLARDKEGNFWSVLGPNWDSSPQSAYRCWSFKVSPAGKVERWSCGLRNGDGICVTPDGDTFVTDNQGEWTGACSLHHVTKNAFHGCPWGIHSAEWLKDVPQTPQALDKFRKRPALIFPYDHLARSPTQPIVDTTGGKFGPFGGQIFVGDHTNPMIIRIALEKVDGEFQGACFPFLTAGVNRGNHRLAFSPDGSLFIGQTVRGWLGQGNEGLQQIKYNGTTPFDVHDIALTPNGFDLNLTLPVDQKLLITSQQFTIRRFRYNYWNQYGSPEIDNAPVVVTKAACSVDRKHISLTVSDLKKEFIYEFTFKDLQSADGSSLSNNKAWYTLNKLQH